jgi:ketosteroid isomerase-like protein
VSQENVEIVRKGFVALNEDGVEALLPFYAPGVVLRSIAEWPDDPIYRGRDGARKLINASSESFDDWAFDAHELRDAGPSVVALAEVTGRIKGSDAPVSLPIGTVFSEFHNGTCGEVSFFITWQQALEAVGLVE